MYKYPLCSSIFVRRKCHHFGHFHEFLVLVLLLFQQDADDKFRNRPAKVKSVPQSKCRVTLTFSDEPNAASVGSVGQSQADMVGTPQLYRLSTRNLTYLRAIDLY